jgi:RHS repeat-associated protein
LSNPIYSYDLAGNILKENGNTLTYDAEDRILTVGSTSYLYDTEEQRISKITGGVETDFTRDFDGTLLDTYVGGSYINQPQEMWIAGRHYGSVYVSVNNGVQEQGERLSLTNWLGSEAMRSFAVSIGANTGVPSYAFLSLPFGDGQTALIGGDHDDIHFTGKERDAETSGNSGNGNDYFGATYYASSMGRMMSPDWSAQAEPVPYAKLDDPQSLNLYAYVGNNPLSGIDPTGHLELNASNCNGNAKCQKKYNKAADKFENQRASHVRKTLDRVRRPKADATRNATIATTCSPDLINRFQNDICCLSRLIELDIMACIANCDQFSSI